MNEIYELEVAKFAYRNENNSHPIKVANYFQVQSRPQNQRVLRNIRSREGCKSRVIYNTIAGEKSILKKCFEIWENVPVEIKSCFTLPSFKKMFKSHLILTKYIE